MFAFADKIGLCTTAPISRSNVSSTSSPAEAQAQAHHHNQHQHQHHHHNSHHNDALPSEGQVPTPIEAINPDASPADSNMFAIEDMIGSPGMIDWVSSLIFLFSVSPL